MFSSDILLTQDNREMDRAKTDLSLLNIKRGQNFPPQSSTQNTAMQWKQNRLFHVKTRDIDQSSLGEMFAKYQ